MANVNMALDEIISKTRPPSYRHKRQGGNRRGFDRQNSFGTAGRKRFARSDENDVVWINIANLPDTVFTQDLQELFQDYNVFGVGVHYDEFGAHMGTADLFVDAPSAQTIIREFSNIAIDGSKIRFAIVSEQAGGTVQFERNRRPMLERTPFRRNDRRRNHRSNSGRSSRTYSKSRSRSPLIQGRKRTNGVAINGRGSRQKNAQKVKTTEELDRELEQYMHGNKHPRIKLEVD